MPSRIATACVAIIAVLALIAIWASAVLMSVQAALSALLIAAAATALRSLHIPQLNRAVLQSDGIWLLSLPQGETAAVLCSSSLLGSMTGLYWRDNGSGRSIAVMLWPDSISASMRRQLLVWLRSGRAHVADPVRTDTLA